MHQSRSATLPATNSELPARHATHQPPTMPKDSSTRQPANSGPNSIGTSRLSKRLSEPGRPRPRTCWNSSPA
jgi:hypothetical protein